MKKLYIFLILISSLFATTYNKSYVSFKNIVTKNIAGNIETIGNTVECVTNLKFAKSLDDINNTTCSNNLSHNDNNYTIKYINVLDDNSSIFNSSTAVLKFPSTYKKIVWAALFWQGHINNYSYQFSFTNKKDKDGYDKYYDKQKYKNGHTYVDEYINRRGNPYYRLSNDLPNNDYKNGIKHTSANEVKLFVNNFSYNIEANEVDYKSNKRYFWDDKKHKWLKKYGVKYSAYAVLPKNIINKINFLSAHNSEVNITIGNVFTTFGLDERLGDYGAWSLIVIYQENPTVTNYRSNMVYYGFKNIHKGKEYNHINIPITGLILPKYGNVSSRLSVFSGEGDYIYKGNKKYPESIRINDEFLDENLSDYDKYNVFDSRLSNDIKRYPKLINNNGIDIDVFNASKQLTEIRNNEREKKPSRITYDVNITASTYNDAVFLSAIAFSTQLYVPKVCYYDLNLYDEKGNKITSSSKLSVGEKIKVQYKIKNDENKTAVNVNVLYPFDNNITKYISNSTWIKNVLEDNYEHFDDNTSHGNLSVEVNGTGLYIGILGDSENEFKPYSVNPKYVAGIEFNLSLQKEGNLSFDFYTDYNYTIGGKPYSYKGILPNCNEFSNTYSVYQPKIGRFNVVHYQPNITNDPIDRNNSINALYTQIVNKEFNVTVVKLKDDNQTVETDFNGIIEVDLINNPKNDNEFKNNPTLWKHYVIFNNNIPELNITYNKADKNLTFRIKYLVDNYGKILEFNNANCINNTNSCIFGMLESRVYPSGVCTPNNHSDPSCICYDECQGSGSSNLGCVDCVFGSSLVRTVSARDSFAIRPYKFAITSVNNKKTAGKEFNITIKALDYNGNPALDYNETLYLNENPPSNSPYLDYNDTNASKGCIRGNLIGTNLVFKNGEANVTLDYSEVGDLNVTIKEINGSEFAKVDEKDTSDKNRIIKQNSTVITFIPSHFKIEGIFKNFNDSNFTYISNDLNMSSILDLNITAQNDKNSTTKNYNSVCYAKNFDLNVSYQISAEINNTIKKILIKEEKETNETNISLPNLIIKNFSKNYFTTDNNGTARLILYINFDKNYSNTVNEFNFTVNDINISDEDNVTGTKYLDKNATFRYGRIDVQNVSGYGNEVNATFSYEYWTDDEGWVVNKEHNSSVFGDVNETNSYHQFVTMNVNHNILNGEENITLSTSHALPYSTKIHLSVPSWLWYHPLAKDYKDPKTTSGWNLDCLTHPCFNVNFQKQSSGWGGVGTNEVNYSEQNRTVEINASTSKIKANKSEVKKLNW